MNRILSCSVFLLFFFSTFIVSGVEEKKAEPTKTEPAVKTATIKEETSVVVYSDPASVRLMPSDKKEVVVTGEGLTQKDWAKVQITSKGKQVKVDYRGGDKNATETLQIQVPNQFDLDIYSTGDITANAPLAGKIKLSTGAGTITTGDIKGSLMVDSTDADITTGNVLGNAVITTNGDVDVQDVSGDLEIKNDHGDSYAKNIGGGVNAKSTDGDISVGEVGANATVNSTIGDIELRKVSGLANLNTDSGDIDLFEATGLVIAASHSGDITLRKIMGSVDVKTEDGDVVTELFAGNGGTSKLFSQEGELAVYFPPEAKATVEVKLQGNTGDLEDQIDSDFKGTKAAGMRKYTINGGGDNVTIETVEGDVLIKKLVPRQVPVAPQTNQ